MKEGFTIWLAERIRVDDISMHKLAKMAGVSHATVSQVVNGKQIPTSEFCIAIASPLRVEESEVLWRAGYVRHKPITLEPYMTELLTIARDLQPGERQDLITVAMLMKAKSISVYILNGDNGIRHVLGGDIKATIHLET